MRDGGDGLFVCGTPLGSWLLVGGLQGNASLPVPLFAVRLALVGRPGSLWGDAPRFAWLCRASRAVQRLAAVRRGSWPSDRAGLSPDAGGVRREFAPQVTPQARHADIRTSQDDDATSPSSGISTSPPRVAGACGGAFSRARFRDHWRRSRGHDALPGREMGSTAFCDCMTMAHEGYSDSGSDCVPLWGAPSFLRSLGWTMATRSSTFRAAGGMSMRRR